MAESRNHLVATDVDGSIAHSNDNVSIVSEHSAVMDDGVFVPTAIVKATGSDRLVDAFDISNPRANDRVFFETRARLLMWMLSTEAQIVITTGARPATMEARREVFDFVDWLVIESGGVILDKNFQRDEEWWNQLKAQRQTLMDFVKFLESKNLVLDMYGRTSAIRIRKRDNPKLNEEDFDGLVHEALLSLPGELKKTENLGHADVIIKSKADALLYLADKLRIDIGNTYAIGDDINDVELLQAAARAVILGNGHPQLLEVAGDLGNTSVTKAKFFDGTIEAILTVMNEIADKKGTARLSLM